LQALLHDIGKAESTQSTFIEGTIICYEKNMIKIKFFDSIPMQSI